MYIPTGTCIELIFDYSFPQVNEFMALGNRMLPVMCSPDQFRSYFSVSPGTNVTDLLSVLCTLNYTQLTDELSQNFMVEAWARKVCL